MRDSFTAGEILVSERDAWSRHNGITGYFFPQKGREGIRAWDIEDGADIQV